MHRLWLTLSLPQTVMKVSVAISILFSVWLLAFTLYLMPPISIVTDCHNLVPKKNTNKNLFLNHFRIVWNLLGSELTRRDQTVMNQWLTIKIVFPIKWIRSNRSEFLFLGWWRGGRGGGEGVLPNKIMGVFIRSFEVKPLKGPRYCFVGVDPNYLYF